ncbi:hypothetical protein HMPREF1019_01871 [Campylobacter sp. 10_1_50]|nr:hypothetical protein HMPREF1019_01871 [Campylobacter sp. 10_1_50]
MIFYDPSIVLTSNHIWPIKAEIQNKYTLYNYIKDAKTYYPNFDIWYFTNVLPSLKDGTKKIITSCDDNNLRGLAILKYNEKNYATYLLCPLIKIKDTE